MADVVDGGGVHEKGGNFVDADVDLADAGTAHGSSRDRLLDCRHLEMGHRHV